MIPSYPTPGKNRYLFLTAHHDYRTARRSSIHFIADELAKRGTLRFFSLRYSRLSSRRGDIRLPLDARANRVEVFKGVQCYLWKTPLHPFALRSRWLAPLESLLFGIYRHLPCRVLDQWLQEADVIIYESGIAPIFYDRAKRLNPHARQLYLASDDLHTIHAAAYAVRTFERVAPQMDALCLVARSMGADIASKHNSYYVPHGLDASLAALGEPSPYGPGLHAVSVGSMLFDAQFFAIASQAFPELTFHVIGSGEPANSALGPNVKLYDHMPYEQTIAYIKHASIGIAPYVADTVPAYLADSSMKMLQYDFFGLPTVCPHTVTGNYQGRFGYQPQDAASIVQAVTQALQAPHTRSRQILSWKEVTDRMVHPGDFSDTQMAQA